LEFILLKEFNRLWCVVLVGIKVPPKCLPFEKQGRNRKRERERERERERDRSARKVRPIGVNAITRINGNCQGLIRGLLLLIGRR